MDDNGLSTPLRVLHLVHWLARGGIESWLLTALRNADRNTLDQDVCCKGPNCGYLVQDYLDTGSRVLHCPMGPLVAPFVGGFARLLKQRKYDLVHVHTHVHSGPAVYAARRVNTPVVTTFHNSMHLPETALTKLPGLRSLRDHYAHYSMRYALQHSTLSTGVSADVVRAVERTAGLERSACRVAHLGVAPPKRLSSIEKERLRAQIGLAPGVPTVVHVGSFTERKNHYGLLKTFRAVADALPEAVLLLIGDGPMRPEVLRRIGDHRLENRVKVLGLRDEVSDLLQLADLFLFPSITEGLSLAFVEATAAGLPIVASDIPGNREASDDGSFARLYPPQDSPGMAAAALQLLRNKPQAVRLGELGREHFRQRMSIGASLDRYQAIYREALGVGEPTRACAAA